MSQGRMRQYGYSGLLNNFTYVKMKGPNKLIETELTEALLDLDFRYQMKPNLFTTVSHLSKLPK